MKAPAPKSVKRTGRDYAPQTETWWTVRSWLKFYGAYPRGFLAKARELVLAGQPCDSPILHVCSGRVRDYQTRGFGPNDLTLDLDPNLKPDYLADARNSEAYNHERWAAILADPPYTADDADHYQPGRGVLPSPYVIVKNSIAALDPGRRVGILHLFAPQAPKGSRFVACVTVLTGFNNQASLFSVYQKMAAGDQAAAKIMTDKKTNGDLRLHHETPIPFDPLTT